MSYMFDIERIAEQSGLSKKVIKQLEQEVRKEFPKDEAMYELHLLRAIETEKKSLAAKAKKKVA
jgi:hypothetical protein